MENPIILKSIF